MATSKTPKFSTPYACVIKVPGEPKPRVHASQDLDGAVKLAKAYADEKIVAEVWSSGGPMMTFGGGAKPMGVPLAERDLKTGKCICPGCGKKFTRIAYGTHFNSTHR